MGYGVYASDYCGVPIELTISCIMDEACDNCDPDGLLQAPISCTDAFGTYNSAMSTLYGMPSNFDPATLTTSSTLEEFGYAEVYISEETFCASSYAYISAAYLDYLTDLGISNNPGAANFLTISEFGATPLGYSNSLLGNALDDYIASDFSDTLSSNYMTWNEYVGGYYMAANAHLCPAASPDPYIPEIELNVAPCDLWDQNISSVNAQNQYSIYIEQVKEAFIQAYVEGAMSSVKEKLTESHLDKEYHYTLYYYDRAGNLVQTIPPEGVHRLEYDGTGTPTASDNGDFAATKIQIVSERNSNPDATGLGTASARLAPDHNYETDYRYNSLNQLVYQRTPDGGVSRFAYDALGRLVLSQNAKQKLAKQFSYTKYDELGRVIEVGELTIPHNNVNFIDDNGQYQTSINGILEVWDGINSSNFPDNLSMNREEVTRTIYDELGSIAATVRSSQGGALIEVPVNTLFGSDYAYDNTRNRIVGVIYQEDYNQSTNVYESATFYDYDVHGNVKHLIQIINQSALVDLNQHIKHTEYEYDLVSGNVNRVIYQRDREDQFMHRYAYDSDNRITIAETSKDGILWEKDAKYFYYEHGPLARTEIGDSKVQASDYAYTIQGWLKAVNGEEVDPTSMMGNDGSQGTLNSQGARDVSGFSLSYYNGDYEASSTNMLNHTNGYASFGPSLYNGNIRSMMTALSDEVESPIATHQTNYEYDQLNRIKSMNGYYREVGQNDQASGYTSNYSFDPNGNLETLTRTAVDDQGSVKVMDDFVYHYDEPINGGINNQLSWVEDNANSTGGFVSEFDDADIDGSMDAGNYTYDDIGQLILDEDEGILNILWKVTNKVEEIHIDTDGDEAADKVIHFDYDPMGNRIAKHVTGISEPMSTYYILDAQGNVMSTYQYDISGQELKLQERNLYGSSRVGVENVYEVLDYIDYDQTIQLANDYAYLSYNGDKSFELSNHLGNVLQVITDRKLPTEGTGLLTDKVDYYTADVIAYTDYYPYGMQMPNRHFSSADSYRYGFNGMEADDEIKGMNNSYDFGARMFDSRVGRWFAPDPLELKFASVSTYSFAFNNPIKLMDSDGNEPIVPEVGGVKAFIKQLTAAGVDDLASLVAVFGGSRSVDENGATQIRYLYSESWGWIDMKHFSSGASYTDNTFITGSMVLGAAEDHELETEEMVGDPGELASSWDYEDLPSNLLGVYFETYLESSEAEGHTFLENLETYLEHLDFVENPLEAAPNEISMTYMTFEDKRAAGVPQNFKYMPIEEHTTKDMSGWLDDRILKYLEEYLGRENSNRKSAAKGIGNKEYVDPISDSPRGE